MFINKYNFITGFINIDVGDHSNELIKWTDITRI